jgi:TonB-dependent receptor
MNRSLIKTTLLAFIAISSFAAGLFGQSEVIVRVVEDATNASLEGATVEIPELNIRRSTDRAGRLTLKDVPEGEFTLEISYRGLPDYSQTFNVTSGEITALPIRLGAPQSASGVDGPVFELEEFVVTSTLTSDDIAQQIERNAINVKDLIASDTMGQLPDQTVADAVRRLPGVSIERSSSNAENEYVAIRGMNSDFNKVMIDGVPLTVGNGDKASRSVPLNVISTALTDTIEVTKAVTPDMDGDAIGGSINIRTRNAFDYGERYASVEATVGFSENLDEYSGDFDVDNYFPALDFILSDFLDDEGTLGYTIGGNYRERAFVTSEIKTSGWGYNTFDEAYQPTTVRFEDGVRDIDELGALISLDWRPDDTSRLAATYSFSRKETEIYRNRLNYLFDPDFSFVLETDGNTGTVVEDTFSLERDVSFFAEEQNVHVFKLDGEKEVGDWFLTGLFGLNISSFEGDPDRDVRARLRTVNEDFFFDATGDPYEPELGAIGLNPETDIAAFDELLNVNLTTFEIDDSEYLFSGDAERSFELFGKNVDFQFGGRVRMRDRDLNEANRFYAPGYILDADEIDRITADYEIDSRVGGNYGRMSVHDALAIRRLTLEQIAAGNPDFDQDADDILFDASSNYEARENIYATYAMGTVQLDKLTILGGARIEFTDVEFKANRVDFDTGDIDPIKETNDYVDILPGLHFRYDATEDFIVRASVNKTLARASYRQLQPTERIDPFNSRYDVDGFLITRGDTGLDPTESWNLDLGFDYYYSTGGYVSLGVFAKFMENNIYQVSEPINNGGIIDELQEFRNANSAEVSGIEFMVDQQFDFLDGIWSNFGASLNVTLVDSSVDTGLTYVDRTDGDAIKERGDEPLFGQVDKALNAAVYYRGDKFRARLSYNWTDEYLDFNGLSGEGPDLDTYLDSYGQFDFSMGYYITDNIEIFFEAENLTDEAVRGFDGKDDRLAFNSYAGRTFFIGASWNL